MQKIKSQGKFTSTGYFSIIANIFMGFIGFCFVFTEIQLTKYFKIENTLYGTIMILIFIIPFGVILDLVEKGINNDFIGKYTKVFNRLVFVVSLFVLYFLLNKAL